MKSFKALRRVLALALVAMLMAGTLTFAAAAGSYYCNANRVNVRYGPGNGYSSKYKLMKGDVVTLVAKSNGWYKVSYFDKKANSAKTGYVYRKYLSSISSKSSGSSSSGATYKTTANLRVRSEASTDSGYIKTKLKKGTKVKVLKQKRSWAYVTYSGGTGWVSAKYLKKV